MLSLQGFLFCICDWGRIGKVLNLFIYFSFYLLTVICMFVGGKLWKKSEGKKFWPIIDGVWRFFESRFDCRFFVSIEVSSSGSVIEVVTPYSGSNLALVFERLCVE